MQQILIQKPRPVKRPDAIDTRSPSGRITHTNRAGRTWA